MVCQHYCQVIDCSCGSSSNNTFDNGVQATVGAESFTWNVSNHGADAAAGTGPHATRDGVGLSFTDAELSAIRRTTGSVRLTLTNAAAATDVVTLDYKTKKKDQDKDVIEDLAGNDLQSIKGVAVVNNTFVDPNIDLTPPSIAAAEIDGDSLTITLNEDIKETVPKATNFKVMNGRKKIKVEDIFFRVW